MQKRDRNQVAIYSPLPRSRVQYIMIDHHRYEFGFGTGGTDIHSDGMEEGRRGEVAWLVVKKKK